MTRMLGATKAVLKQLGWDIEKSALLVAIGKAL